MRPSSSLLHRHVETYRCLRAPIGCSATPLHARSRRRPHLCPRPEIKASSTREATTHTQKRWELRQGHAHGVARAAAAGTSLAAVLLLQLAPVPALSGPALAADGAVMRQAVQGAAGPEAVTAPGVGAASGSSGAANDAALMQTIYFGNGCFWGRQKDFVEVERGQLGRSPEQLTALVGYAAGTRVGPDGKVCYYYADPRTQYEALGHAEVVRLGITAGDQAAAEREMRAFAARYFEQFTPLIDGTMDRLDPQDQGPAYRNVIGIPGGVNSPLFPIIQEANKYGMDLREGRGNDMQRGRPTEGDLLNVVWVVDSDRLPFYRAERYHQFHHGLGKLFSLDYVRDLRNQIMGLGKIDPTGCPELPF